VPDCSGPPVLTSRSGRGSPSWASQRCAFSRRRPRGRCSSPQGESGTVADRAELEQRVGALPLAALPLDERACGACTTPACAGSASCCPATSRPRPAGGADFSTGWTGCSRRPDPRPSFTPCHLPGAVGAAGRDRRGRGSALPGTPPGARARRLLLGRQLGAQRLDWQLDHAVLPPSRFSLGLARADRRPGGCSICCASAAAPRPAGAGSRARPCRQRPDPAGGAPARPAGRPCGGAWSAAAGALAGAVRCRCGDRAGGAP